MTPFYGGLSLAVFGLLLAIAVLPAYSSSTTSYCCDCPSTVACTYTQGYWKNHNRYETKPSQSIPWPINEDTTICSGGSTWLTILQTPPQGGNAWLILAHQYVAARLNVADGAIDNNGYVLTWIDQATALLTKNCPSEAISAADRATAIYLAGLLDAFNNGLYGPRHCGSSGEEDESTGSSTLSSPCPLSQGYWKTHVSAWPTSVSPTSFCGINWTTILQTPPRGNAWYILAKQTIAALLNSGNGADTSGIASYLSAAVSLLTDTTTCNGGNPAFTTESDVQQALWLAEILDRYNNGLLTSNCGGTATTCTNIGCCSPCSYWQSNPYAWPVPPTSTTYTLCGQTWLAILKSTSSSTFYALARQYIAARLNILNGAYGVLVQNELDAAAAILNAHCADKLISSTEAGPLISCLSNFNNGYTIVPRCGGCPTCICPTTATKVSLEKGASLTTRVVAFDLTSFSVDVTPSGAWDVAAKNNNDGTWSVAIAANQDSNGSITYRTATASSSSASFLRPGLLHF